MIKILKQILTTLLTTYFLGLLWYRFSDSWQASLTPDEDEQNYFVVFFKLRPKNHDYFNDDIDDMKFEPSSQGMVKDTEQIQEFVPQKGKKKQEAVARMLFGGSELGIEKPARLSEIKESLVACMYFALTTLATVGYGDFFPKSMAEKIVGSII